VVALKVVRESFHRLRDPDKSGQLPVVAPQLDDPLVEAVL
jgi:hypothetical protein